MPFPETVSPFTFHAPPPGKTGWSLSENRMWLPVVCADRDACLLIAGMVTAGVEQTVLLQMRDRYNWARPCVLLTVGLIVAHMAGLADGSIPPVDLAYEIRKELAEHARAKGNIIAGKPGDPPDPRFPVRGETRLYIAEGWYQAAGWLDPDEEATG